jgi:hypothetical protein
MIKCNNNNNNNNAALAQVGSLDLEFRYLSDATGDPVFADKVRLLLIATTITNYNHYE